MVRVFLLFGLASILGQPAAFAQPAAPPPGTIEATISTQGGTVLLPGVLVEIVQGAQTSEQVSDGNGHVALTDLPRGTYRLHITLDGFEPVDRTVTIGD